MGNFDNKESRKNKLPQAIYEKSEEEWKKILDSQEYYVMREQGTERPFSKNNFHDNKKKGVYRCKGCNTILFDSEGKFNSGTI